jgi:hypothetical protein
MTERIERTPSAFRVNLEQQKKRAKELLRAARAGDAQALARIVAARTRAEPSVTTATDAALKLAEAQFVIARELRFASWAKLKAHVAAMDRQWAAIADNTPAPDGELKTLHIRCGHDIQNTLEDAGFTGDFYPLVTPYCQGPVTNGPERHELMARFIVDGFGDLLSRPLDYASVLDGERRQDALLARTADEYERVVIWMEYDNYDQLALARLLAHYASARRPRVLELILADEFPGSDRFLGVGQLPPEALRMLWPTRRAVSEPQLTLGREVWDALASPDPRRLAAIARAGTPAIPVMAPALLRQLRELPDVANGLSFTERLILQILDEQGTVSLNTVFVTLLKREPLFFIGDAGVARVIRDMERADEPPVVRTIETPGERSFRNKLTLTDAGRDVLRATRDWHSLNPAPRWVGGVHVQPGLAGWRWDEAKREPVWAPTTPQ